MLLVQTIVPATFPPPVQRGYVMLKKTKPNSPLTEAMARYEAESGRKFRNGSTSCRAFDRLMGKHAVESITWEMLRDFATKLRAAKLKQFSIGRYIGDVKTVVHFITGKRLLPPVESIPADTEPVDMETVLLSRWAIKYCHERQISRREPIYSTTRFVRHMGDMRVADITTENLIQFRNSMLAEGLTPVTIESSISDVQTLLKAAGRTIDGGRRCKLARPRPKPITFEALDAVWPYCDGRLRQWMVVSYWTALRLSDAMNLMVSLTADVPDVLEWTASKTQHLHRWPVVPWLHRYLTRRKLPFKSANSYALKSLRRGIAGACDAAGVDRWNPKYLRQLSLSQWSRTDPLAGQIIHGCGLNSVLKHYLDPLIILQGAALKLPVPERFTAVEPATVETSELVSLFRNLNPAQQVAVKKSMLEVQGRGMRNSFGEVEETEAEPTVLRLSDWH